MFSIHPLAAALAVIGVVTAQNEPSEPRALAQIGADEVHPRCFAGALSPRFADPLSKGQVVRVGEQQNGFRQVFLPLGPRGLVAKKFPYDDLHLLAVGHLGSGGVVTAGSEIDCGDDCGDVFPAPAFVVLTATPLPNHVFTGWSGCDSVNGNECTVVVEGLRVVQAGFRFDLVAQQF